MKPTTRLLALCALLIAFPSTGAAQEAAVDAVNLDFTDQVGTLSLDQTLDAYGNLGGVTVDQLGFLYVANFRDAVWRISPEGEVVDRLSLLKAFLGSPFRDLLEPIKNEGDIFHANTVEWLDGSQVDESPLFRRGNLVVSLREVDIVAIVDPARRSIDWAQRGPWDAQHQPELLDDGRLLIFDNRGRDGFSRVVELDVGSGEIGWQYPTADAVGDALWSPEAGSSQRLPGGNTLITESERGRALEVTPEGELVWEFLSPHRAGPQKNLVATLFDVVRLPPEAAAFLEVESEGG